MNSVFLKNDYSSFRLKWIKSKEYCSSYDSNFVFRGKNIHLRISMESNYTAVIALRTDREDEFQTPALVVGDEDSDVDDCIVKLQSDAEKALLKCFETGKLTLACLIKNMGYSISRKEFTRLKRSG